MYNKFFINILLKVLGWITAVGTGIFFISVFFVAADRYGSTAGKVGYWIGYEIAGLAMIAFLYVLLGVMYRVNNQ